MFMSAFASPSVLSVSPAPIFSSSLSGLSPAVCKAFFLRFCSATLSPSVSRISLTSRASLPFKWGGLPLKGLRGCSPCKAYTHTADAPHPCPPSIWAPVKKKKSMRSPRWSRGCEGKNVRFERTSAVEELCEIVMSDSVRRPAEEERIVLSAWSFTNPSLPVSISVGFAADWCWAELSIYWCWDTAVPVNTSTDLFDIIYLLHRNCFRIKFSWTL